MEFIRLSPKVTLGFGLAWEQHDPYSLSLHAQIQKWRSLGYTDTASYKSDSGEVFGLVRSADNRPTADGKSSKTAKGVLAGAICIATHPQIKGKTGLVLIEFEEQGRASVIAVGIRNGVLVFDKIIRPEDVSEQRNAFLKQIGGTEVPQTWGDLHSNAPTDHLFTLADLAPGKKAGKGVPIQALRSSRWPLVLGMATLATAVVAGGWWAWDAYQVSQAQALRQRQLAEQTPAVLYAKEVQQWMARPVVLLAPSLALVRERFLHFPVVSAGWVLEKVSCATGQCQVGWVRKDGTLAEFRAVAPADWKSITATDQSHIVMVLDLAMPTAQLESKAWPQSGDYRDGLLSHWQYLAPGGWKADMGVLTQQAIPTAFTLPQRQAVANVPDAPQGFDISAQNQPWWYAGSDSNAPLSAAQVGSNVEMTGPIELTFDGHQLFFGFKGTAYVHR